MNRENIEKAIQSTDLLSSDLKECYKDAVKAKSGAVVRYCDMIAEVSRINARLCEMQYLDPVKAEGE